MSQTKEVKETVEKKEETQEIEETTKRVFRTEPLRSVNEIVDDLHKNVHPTFIKSRKQAGTTINYIAWYDATKYLDKFAPGWTYEVKNIQQFGNNIVITTRISIPTSEGIFFREATGFEDIGKAGYGDPFSNAESMSLRRCAAKWGLGQHLYRDK